MSSALTAIGPEAKIKVNNVLLGVRGGGFRAVADKAEVTTTADYPYKRFRDATLCMFEMNVDAFRQSDVSPHVGTLAIQEGEFIDLKFYPFGTTDDYYWIPTFFIEAIDGSFRVEGSQPQEFKFNGVGSGTYQKYDE